MTIKRNTNITDPDKLIRSAQVYAKAAEGTLDIDHRASETLSALSMAQSSLALALMTRSATR